MAADEILFLGTAGDEYVTGKQLRASGGIVLRILGYQFILDPGPGCLVQAHKHNINLRETTAVLVSHAHINHCNDINAVLSAMSHNKLDVQGVLIATEQLVNGSETQKPYLTEFHKGCVERILLPKAGQKIGIEEVEIDVLKAKHFDTDAVGFKFITPRYTVVYSGDTKYNTDIAREYEGADILILNVTSPADKKSEYNLNTDDALNIIQRVQPKVAILTHFGKDLIEAHPVYAARDISRATGVQVIAAEDGAHIDISYYASKTKQVKLGEFEESSSTG